MKKVFKVMLNVVIGIIILLALLIALAWVSAEIRDYFGRVPDECLNDVSIGLCRTVHPNMLYIEQKEASPDNGVNVWVEAQRVLQTGRIEGRTLQDFKSLNFLELRQDEDWHTYGAAYDAIQQFPNILDIHEETFQPLENVSVTTVIDIQCSGLGFGEFLPDHEVLHNWRTRKWTGPTDELPTEIEAYRQRLTQLMSLPRVSFESVYISFRKYEARAAAALPDTREYPAYLRAVPLFTQEALEAEKDTPLIDLETTRNHVRLAVKHPYVFLPIPQKRLPFPTVKTFTPGDKFKVDHPEGGCFLIETFRNGNLDTDKQK